MNWTQEQANAFEARRSIKVRFLKGESFSPPIELEADLHAQIIDECKRLGWIAFHGSMAHQTFRTEGEPDFVILRDAGKLLLVECKAKGGKLSTAQMAIAAWADKLGHAVHVVRNIEEFLKLL